MNTAKQNQLGTISRTVSLNLSLAGTLAITLMSSNPLFARGVARVALESGGETIIEVRTTDGDSSELKGGGFAHLELGFVGNLISSDPAWETEGTLGYKFDSQDYENGDMSFTRYTLNLMQYYRLVPAVRLGAGATYHLNGNVEVDIPGIAEGDADFDNALGLMFAADYTFSESVNVGARVTRIDYELSDVSNAEALEGNSVGAYVSLNF